MFSLKKKKKKLCSTRTIEGILINSTACNKCLFPTSCVPGTILGSLRKTSGF